MTIAQHQGGLTLHAVVPGAAAGSRRLRAPRGAQALVCRDLVALVSLPMAEEPIDGALRHDRIVQRAIETFGAVVPFRAATLLRSSRAVLELVEGNAQLLGRQLSRFSNRVEMGLKAAISRSGHTEQDQQTFDRWVSGALSGLAVERIERMHETEGGMVFDASYLIARERVPDYWAAVRSGSQGRPGVHVIGTGPWAPYTFCDFTLAG